MIYQEKKICSKCKQLKILDQFSKRGRKNELRPSCKKCEYEQFKKWKAKQIRKPTLLRNKYLAELKKKVYPTENTKICSKCGIEKSLSEYGKGSHRFQCKECRSIFEKKSYSQEIEKRAKRRALWRQNHLEKARKYAVAGFHKRRTIKLIIESTLTTKEWIEIVEKYGGKCLCCGRVGNITMDHVIPISKGGPHSAANIQPLCGSCNSSKGTKTIDYRSVAGGLK